MYEILTYFALFLIYSIIGWTIEVICCSFHDKKISNRGFLIGPYCPIYGFSAILMTMLLKKYTNDLIALFVMSVLICSIMEYLTSYIMEKLFHARWWDYSEKSFNINGRICLSNSIMFGILGVLLIKIINPFTYGIIIRIPKTLFIVVTLILGVIFIVDLVMSFNIINKLKITTDNIRKDHTEEINKKVKEILSKRSILHRRLINAFPNFNALTKKIEKIKERKK